MVLEKEEALQTMQLQEVAMYPLGALGIDVVVVILDWSGEQRILLRFGSFL